ncbi:MAG: segregation/condensation protein A [Defluviitaleaceae bacterium]|nr:segregation/condensation protein A [Defluviitaleaceae bacterium]
MEITVADYNGPFDVLLRQIHQNKIDIYNIPMAELTAQYLEKVSAMEKSGLYDMNQMSEYVLMAATLLEIKSKMLLPKPKNDSDEVEEDPREALVQKLLAYQQAQALAAELTRISPPGIRISGAGEPSLLAEIEKDIDAQSPIMEGVDLAQIWDIFTDVMSRRAAKRDPIRADFGEMQRERFTLPEKIAYIRLRLETEKQVLLSSLFENCRSRTEMVVTFLALLEMIRQGMIKARQNRAFDDVFCSAA